MLHDKQFANHTKKSTRRLMLSVIILDILSMQCSMNGAGATYSGNCDFKTVSINDLTRKQLVTAQEPFLINDVTRNWSALDKWTEENFMNNYGDEVFHLHDTYNETVSDLLKPGVYKMGHVLQKGYCYADPYRPYSPLLMGKLRHDYYIPEPFLPLGTFQIGIGRGQGVGVPPEDHPSSWFAMVAGTKRWVVHPPSETKPPNLMRRPNCDVTKKFENTMVCDQYEGDILWLPNYWWHETCGIENYSVGIGALTYEGCEISPETSSSKCLPNEREKKVYSVLDIAFCTAHEENCVSLPY